jgi:predicted nuclease of predicted toxin-antitoxin system
MSNSPACARGPILAWAVPVNPPKLLLDENLSPAIALTLLHEGFDVIHVRDRRLLNATDVEIFARALQEDRILVTSDVDHFAKIGHRTNPPAECSSRTLASCASTNSASLAKHLR